MLCDDEIRILPLFRIFLLRCVGMHGFGMSFVPEGADMHSRHADGSETALYTGKYDQRKVV